MGDFDNDFSDLDDFDSIDWSTELPDGIQFDTDESEDNRPSAFESEYSVIGAKRFGDTVSREPRHSPQPSIEWQSKPKPDGPITVTESHRRRENVVGGRRDRRSDNSASSSKGTDGRKRSRSRTRPDEFSTTTSGETGRGNQTNGEGSAGDRDSGGSGLTGAELKSIDKIIQRTNTSGIPQDRNFHSATFACYIKGSKFTPDGEMEVVVRIPAQDILEGMKLAFAYQKILICQITKRQSGETK